MEGQHAFLVGAMRAAIEIAGGLHAVADNLAAAMVAFRSQGMDGTFEAIKVMGDAVYDNFQGLVVFVSADFTSVHDQPRSRRWRDGLQFVRFTSALGGESR